MDRNFQCWWMLLNLSCVSWVLHFEDASVLSEVGPFLRPVMSPNRRIVYGKTRHVLFETVSGMSEISLY